MDVAYWGSGPISHFHIPALKKAGAKITTCFSRTGSDRLKNFCETHNLDKASSEREFLEKCSEVDAVFVALRTENTLEALSKLNGSFKVFFEKPGALKSKDLLALKDIVDTKNFFSLYNRRFYSTIDYVKEFVYTSSTPVNLTVYFPDTKKGIHQFFINGCHAIDLSLYLLDDFSPKINGVIGNLADSSSGFSFIAESKDGHVLNFSNPWGAPSRARLDCFNSEINLQLMPFEALQVSDSMDIIEPTHDMPLRRYVPNAVYKDFVNSELKPGFLEQAEKALEYTSDGFLDKRLCSFEQSVQVLEFMENVLEKFK